jgi:bifunctional non-homologous end joining protein LigD
VQVAAIELHPYLSSATKLEYPDFVVFDVDPGAPAGIVQACRAAVDVGGLLNDFRLVSVAKTSGAKGLHVYAPVGAGHTTAETKAFAGTAAAAGRRAANL